jgi:hypothetical protein
LKLPEFKGFKLLNYLKNIQGIKPVMVSLEKIADNNQTLTQLKCPNQFVLGPGYLDCMMNWKQIQVKSDLYLMVHPGLDVCRAEDYQKSLILIGYILDSKRPAADNFQILSELLSMYHRFDDFYEKTYCFGGRWIIIANDDNGSYLFNDAAGHRQVFYTKAKSGPGLWCASQPRLLAEITSCKMSSDAVQFINTYKFRQTPEFRWPGYGSPYLRILHLLPNHYLNLDTGTIKRYWPVRTMVPTPLIQAVEMASRTLSGLIEAAANRFELVVSLTAGLDSRTVLAASRKIVANNPVMTVRQIDKPEDHADVLVASKLASLLGLQHDVIQSSLIIDDEFLHCFKQNTAIPHFIYAPDAQAIYNWYQRKKVVVTGSISEIGRLSFREQLGKPESEPIDAYDLVKLQKMERHAYAVNAFNDWLSGIGKVHNIPLLDLFEWEQGHGNWLAMCHLEFDIAWKDIFAPFNCRDLLTLLLSVDRRYRKPPDYTLYREIIKFLWPDLLKIPINPHENHKNENHKKKIIALLKANIPYPLKKQFKRFFGRLPTVSEI